MIAVDTNVLVYAHRQDSEFHDRARTCVKALAESRSAWGIPWPCIHEFYAIATHPRIYDPPSSRDSALTQLDIWFESPSLVMLGESTTHWSNLRTLISDGQIRGPAVHDARIAAICLSHGVRELWTADRDFARFPQLRTFNPLLGSQAPKGPPAG